MASAAPAPTPPSARIAIAILTKLPKLRSTQTPLAPIDLNLALKAIDRFLASPSNKAKPAKATTILAKFARWREGRCPRNKFLFPSRKSRVIAGKRTWVPNPKNRLSSSSFLLLLRKALTEVCGLTAVQAQMFTVHALRVGGINYYKSIGVSIGLRAQIAAHKSIATARRYVRLLPHEQLEELASMVNP